mgnify:CR=1 FL=1
MCQSSRAGQSVEISRLVKPARTLIGGVALRHQMQPITPLARLAPRASQERRGSQATNSSVCRYLRQQRAQRRLSKMMQEQIRASSPCPLGAGPEPAHSRASAVAASITSQTLANSSRVRALTRVWRSTTTPAHILNCGLNCQATRNSGVLLPAQIDQAPHPARGAWCVLSSRAIEAG